ncbi:MAG TPA: FKBP-type peptidyl-prolyl cis-trans isomerase [Balneolaceae bacterium]|nr:FKBP-type peptidyl-prolyl cis-trans isomerase [Balneolaceae bacterium]
MTNKKLAALPVLFIVAFIAMTSCNNKSAVKNGNFNSTIDSVSYAFGYLTGEQMEQGGMTTLDLDYVTTGMQRALSEDTSLIKRSEMIALLRDYQVEARARMMKKQSADAKENKEKAEDFLAENKKEEGVQTTESGLQYKVLEEGNGTSPNAEDTVTVNYEGKLLNGDIFDSSYKRGQPATFPLNQVIEGWTEGVQLMKEGAVYKFWIPANMAYGSTPPPNSPIGPGELLVFKVELLEVK